MAATVLIQAVITEQVPCPSLFSAEALHSLDLASSIITFLTGRVVVEIYNK
jgi:hypothetical protein